MAALLWIIGVVYFATLVFVVVPLCFGIIINVWREALHRDKEQA